VAAEQQNGGQCHNQIHPTPNWGSAREGDEENAEGKKILEDSRFVPNVTQNGTDNEDTKLAENQHEKTHLHN
jgi:hypothetical protein